MSANKSPLSLLTLILSAGGLGLYQLYQNLTSAHPKDSLWIKLSRYSRYSDWIEAQARHESANYTSDAYLRSNNPFGMKNASKRVQLGWEVEGDPYRHYKDIGQAIRDYLLYLDEFNVPKNIGSVESFVSLLKDQGYFEDRENTYLNGVKFFLDKIRTA